MRVNRNSISQFIVEAIANSADGFAKLDDFLEHPSLYAYAGGRTIPPQSGFAQALRRLKKQEVIKEVVVDGRLVYKLLNPTVIRHTTHHSVKWDGCWRIVIFDIPERQRVVRDLFRRNLKNWGFKQVQKSVWASKQPIYQEVVAEIKRLKIAPWVEIVEAKRSTLH